jgi:hypothetical protein
MTSIESAAFMPSGKRAPAKPAPVRGKAAAVADGATPDALPLAPDPPDESPLDYMLRVMRDPSQEPARRDAMAKACAPYVHGRLGSGDHPGGEPEQPADIGMNEACRRMLFTITQADRERGE